MVDCSNQIWVPQKEPCAVLSLGWGVQFSLFSQPGGPENPLGTLLGHGMCQCLYQTKALGTACWQCYDRTNGDQELRPSLPWVLYLGAGSILDQGANKGLEKPTARLSMFLWGLKDMKWGLHAFSGCSLVSGKGLICPAGCSLSLCLSW